MDFQEYKKIFSSAYSQDSLNLEKAIELLKTHGAHQVDCVMVVMSELNIPLQQADEFVLNSIAWSHTKDETAYIRDKFAKFFDEL